jgi:hypothetical protein
MFYIGVAIGVVLCCLVTMALSIYVVRFERRSAAEHDLRQAVESAALDSQPARPAWLYEGPKMAIPRTRNAK